MGWCSDWCGDGMMLMGLWLGCSAPDVAEEPVQEEPELPSFSEVQAEPTWSAAEVAATAVQGHSTTTL